VTTELDVLGIARSKVGLEESPPGSNRQPFGEWYGYNGVAWCAQFVSFCAYTAGLPLPATTSKGFAYCPFGAAWFERQGAWGTMPKVGAIVFFGMPGSGDRINHVGIVEAVPGDGSIITIEGNTTAPGAVGSDRSGGAVARKRRVLNDPVRRVIGFGYPAYKPLEESPVIKRRRRVGEYVDIMIRPDGGLWGLQEDGGVINVPAGGPFFDSESARFKKEGRKAVALEPWHGGYCIIDSSLARYHHPDPAWKG
jgi:hypothetical protein